MISKEIKVEVIFDSKNQPFKEVFPLGLKTVLHTHKSEQDETISRAYETKKGEKIPAHFRPKGSYIGYSVVGGDNEEYSEYWISRIIGNMPIDQIFKKI